MFLLKKTCFSLKLAQFKSLTNDLSLAVWSTECPQLLVPCISNENITPEKKREMMKAFSSAQLAGRDRGEGVGEKERVHAASHSYFSSVFGASAGSLYFISFSPLPVSSHPLCCFPSHQPSLPPSPTPYPSPSCLSASPRGLIYGCGAPETAMTTHAFLCFVSSLAYWLALWLTACTCCVSALYSCHAVSLLPQSKKCFPLSFCLVRCCRAGCLLLQL